MRRVFAFRMARERRRGCFRRSELLGARTPNGHPLRTENEWWILTVFSALRLHYEPSRIRGGGVALYSLNRSS